MREPPVKKILYWCRECNIPLIGRTCSCGSEGYPLPLQEPYDVRPALEADLALIRKLLHNHFGQVPVPQVVLLNKAGGLDRHELVIADGVRFGWLSFDPVSRAHTFEIVQEALPFLLKDVKKGLFDLESAIPRTVLREQRRIGGKKFRVSAQVPEGPVILRYRSKYGVGILKDGYLKVKELGSVTPQTAPDPGWEDVVGKNRYHLKNLERNAIREIRQHMHDRPVANVSFSGGKDSTAVLALARKAGVQDAFFIDTGLEFPETIEFVKAQGATIVPKGGDFWAAVEKAGPPGKDHRWCCKLLKLFPLKRHLATTGPCVTIQGNRWYESWNRADLEVTSQNPDNPLQLNISPIRNWRALEVYLYLWWQNLPINPLYGEGIERIGCYLCPAMLESEYDEVHRLHPDLARRWDEFLARYARDHGLPGEYYRWGLWRWRDLPAKMRELAARHGLDLTERAPARNLPVQEPKIKGEPYVIALEEIRNDFPLLADIVYLDNAATSLSPEPVVQVMVEFEHFYRANVGRGVHRLSQIATQRYWHAHQKMAEFIGASSTGEVVFTKNSTEAINMVAQGLPWKPGDRVVTTILEHHSNLLPWRRLSRQGVELVVVGITDDYQLDLAALEDAVDERTRLVTVTHASNVLGTVTPVPGISRICREHGSLLLVDGAQSVPHMPVSVEQLGCDFLCCSGHKMLGPTGTGVLWMREPVLEPMLVGGGSVEAMEGDEFVFSQGYQKYEAGTPNISGGIGLGAAVDYLRAIGMETIRDHDRRLTARIIDGLSKIEGVSVYAQRDPDLRIGVVSFTVRGFDPHAVAHYLDENADIMVRSGHHCCIPLMRSLGLENGSVRASLYIYNTEDDVDRLIATVGEIARGG